MSNEYRAPTSFSEGLGRGHHWCPPELATPEARERAAAECRLPSCVIDLDGTLEEFTARLERALAAEGDLREIAMRAALVGWGDALSRTVQGPPETAPQWNWRDGAGMVITYDPGRPGAAACAVLSCHHEDGGVTVLGQVTGPNCLEEAEAWAQNLIALG